MLREHQFQIPSGLDIVAAKARQVFDQHDIEPVLLHIAQHVLKAGAVEARARPPIVYIFLDHSEALPRGIFPQQRALVLDAFAFAAVVIVAAQP